MSTRELSKQHSLQDGPESDKETVHRLAVYDHVTAIHLQGRETETGCEDTNNRLETPN